MNEQEKVTDAVKAHYASLARQTKPSCCAPSSCCTPAVTDISTGYTSDDLAHLPAGANMGLGCGNPTAMADIKPGETVIDLGSGPGIDCFLAAPRVGPQGRVIGIDMTPEMIARARANATAGGYGNVEFRLGQIEDMPVESGTADMVISNCVINLSPDKPRVFAEIHRVLRPGGRFSVSDIVANGTIPPEVRTDMEKWAGCVAGALGKDEYLDIIRRAGFTDITIKAEVEYDYHKTDNYSLASITVTARKP